MKKTILSVAAIGLFAATLASCNSTKKAEGSKDSSAVEVTDSTKKDSTTVVEKTTTKSDAPTFSSDEVNKGLAEYAKLKDEYIAALKSKNATEIQALGTKYATWAQSSSTWASKLKPDEVQKYSDYMTKLSQEWTAAATEAVK
ncbi:hypothetical protein ACFOG5_21895 [Pedobacter fastidiosus]|uniref:Lipoprotein n=1 Tax=Pedobacter fastidiosus TaxID=2765361 RepID=A0ABR7KNF4_9SPHI|nr:hypothetical protein [Pedobacter fastidiosus]MBC6109604.1 hypothetical protein [Pedobacter fastidiosus]